MTYYVNPPNRVAEVGRRLQGNDYSLLAAQLKEGEVLVGLFDRLIFKNAPVLADEEEMENFTRQVRRGLIFTEGYYAVRKEDL